MILYRLVRAQLGPDKPLSATAGLLGALKNLEKTPKGPRDSRKASKDPDGLLNAAAGLLGAQGTN